MRLTIEVSPGISDKLRKLSNRVNENLAEAGKLDLDYLYSIEDIATALIEVALSESSKDKIAFKRDKIAFTVMVAQQQLFENKSKHTGERL